MKRVTVALPNEIHQHLKMQASENHTSITQLVREAIVYVYHEDLEDIKTMEGALAEHDADPSSVVSLEKLRQTKQANTEVA